MKLKKKKSRKLTYGGLCWWWRCSCELGSSLANGSSSFLCVFCISSSPCFYSPTYLFHFWRWWCCCWWWLEVAMMRTADGDVAMVLFMNEAIVHKELLLLIGDSFSSSVSLFLSSPSFFLSLVLSKCCSLYASLFSKQSSFSVFFSFESLFVLLSSLFLRPSSFPKIPFYSIVFVWYL